MTDDWSKSAPAPMQSESIAELAQALAKAQGLMSGALKDAANPFFKSKYADLESVWGACRKPLADNGLAVIQTTDWLEGVRIITTLTHASGQWVRGVLPIMATDTKPQAIGSAITYARRYALAAIVGVYQTDDDAEAAHGRATQPQTPKEDRPISHQDPRIAEYVKRLNEAFELGVNGPILDIRAELQEDQSLMQAVWGRLPSGMRRQIKDLIDAK